VFLNHEPKIMAMNSEHGHLNKSRQVSANPSPKLAEIAIRNAYDASEYACLERCLRELAGVTDVHLDPTRGVAHLSYDASQTSPEKIQSDVARLVTVAIASRVRGHHRMPDILQSVRSARRRTI